MLRSKVVKTACNRAGNKIWSRVAQWQSMGVGAISPTQMAVRVRLRQQTNEIQIQRKRRRYVYFKHDAEQYQ